MDAKLQPSDILSVIPTFLLVVFLHFFLKSMLFKPLEKVLHQRYEATEGTRKLAEAALAAAEAKTSEYEAAMRAARAEIYQAQEEMHKRLDEREGAELHAARTRADEAVQKAKDELTADAATARKNLAQQIETLANQIAESILRASADNASPDRTPSPHS